jgi:hypothetical protein
MSINTTVSNVSNPLVQFRVRGGTGNKHFQQVLPHENPDHCNWASITNTTGHFNLTILAPIKYLSSDSIVTRSICRLCRINRSFTSRVHICNPTNICLVAIKNLPILPKIELFFKATQRLSVGSPIGMWEVKVWFILYNLCIDHVTI